MPRPRVLTRCGQPTHPTSESQDGASTTFTVMDDFPRFIIAWRLQRDRTSDSFIEVAGRSRPHRHDRRSMGASHKALGNVTPSDVLDGCSKQILQKRKEVQTQTFQRRRFYNQQLREFAQSARSLH